MSQTLGSIRDVLMKCELCALVSRLEDCNCDDLIGDGRIGCPVEDCGGEMLEMQP